MRAMRRGCCCAGVVVGVGVGVAACECSDCCVLPACNSTSAAADHMRVDSVQSSKLSG
jgi:hypothetical protein